MKKLLLLAVLLLSVTLQSCQCSSAPPVGPVEGQDGAVADTSDL